MRHTLTLLTALLLASLAALQAADAPKQKPNLVIIFTDDMGYADIGAYGCKDIPTPHLDRLAAEGTRFTSAYTVAPICVPSRMGLMSGKFPARFGVFNNVYTPEENQLWMQQTTLADVLKSRGYRTANVGKWHLSGGGPEKHGYDVSDGDTGNREAEAFKDPNPVDIFGMTDRAKAFMEKNVKAGNPFYLQMSYHALHVPENANRSSLAKFEAKTPGKLHHDPARAAIAYDLDTGVGNLLAALSALGLDKNTYVIYMGDNGGGGGGGGGGSCRMRFNIQTPRLRGLESLPSEFIASIAATVKIPPRFD